MTVVVAIGTRKGLLLARSDDRGRWSLDGPHFLMEEVASVAWDTRRSPARLLVGVMSWHWGPTVAWSDDLGATWNETDHAAIAFPEDTEAALARVWQIQPDTADRPGVVWAGCEPTSLWRSEDGGESFDLVRGLWDHPHRPDWAPGFGGAAVHTVLPNPTTRPGHGRDEHRRRLRERRRRHRLDAAQQGHLGEVPARPLPGVRPVRAQGRRRRERPGPHVRAEPPRRLPHDDGGRTWESIAEGLPSDFGFVALASPRTPGTFWVMPLEADARRVPPDGRMRVHRTRDAGDSWTELGAGLPGRLVDRRPARRRLRRFPGAHRPLPRHPGRLRLRQRRRGRLVVDDRGAPARRPVRARRRPAVTEPPGVTLRLPSVLADLVGGRRSLTVSPGPATVAELLDAVEPDHPRRRTPDPRRDGCAATLRQRLRRRRGRASPRGSGHAAGHRGHRAGAALRGRRLSYGRSAGRMDLSRPSPAPRSHLAWSRTRDTSSGKYPTQPAVSEVHAAGWPSSPTTLTSLVTAEKESANVGDQSSRKLRTATADGRGASATVSPVSSRTSRTAASRGSSPSSTLPPGGTQPRQRC